MHSTWAFPYRYSLSATTANSTFVVATKDSPITNALPSLLQLLNGVLHLTEAVTGAAGRILTNLRACGMISPIYANILTWACHIPASFTDSE